MAKKESTFTNMVLTLFAVTFIASLALGGIYNLTKEPIAAARKAKLENAIRQVVSDFDRIEQISVMPETGKDSLTFFKAFKNDELIATAIRTYSNQGYGGEISVMVGFTPDGEITNTAVIEHKETPGLGDKMDVSKSDWSKQFMRNVIDKVILQLRKFFLFI